MKTLSPHKHAPHKHTFPQRFRIGGTTIALRLLDKGSSDAMIDFARTLPEQDLLFLERDITTGSEVDRWINEVAAGRLVTIVAWQGETVIGYATYHLGHAPWTLHVAELRVVVAESARGLGVGRLLLEFVFEMALEEGATKVIARMTPDQVGARSLFKRLGFEEEAVLKDHARDMNGCTHDLLVLSFHTRQHQAERCGECGVPVLSALSLDGIQLCSHCFELRYGELGGGG